MDVMSMREGKICFTTHKITLFNKSPTGKITFLFLKIGENFHKILFLNDAKLFEKTDEKFRALLKFET